MHFLGIKGAHTSLGGGGGSFITFVKKSLTVFSSSLYSFYSGQAEHKSNPARWCRQNSHVTCSKTRWRSTAYIVLRYFSVFPDRFWYLFILKKISSLVKGILFPSSWQSDCVIFFTIQTAIAWFTPEYSKVPGFACFRWLSEYSKMIKSSLPSISCNGEVITYHI